MISLRMIVADIENLATSGELAYSFRIEDTQIAYWVHQTRSILISQAIQKKQDLSDTWIQAISCVALEQVDGGECCDSSTNCYILRSVDKLPDTVETYIDNSIIRVVTASGEIISKFNPFSAKYQSYSKYTSKKPMWYIKNDYLYIEGDTDIETVTVYGIFENPEELAEWINCDDESCFSWDSSYPCSMKMASQITDIVFKTKIMPFYSTNPDTANNAHNESGLLQNKNIQENKL